MSYIAEAPQPGGGQPFELHLTVDVSHVTFERALGKEVTSAGALLRRERNKQEPCFINRMRVWLRGAGGKYTAFP